MRPCPYADASDVCKGASNVTWALRLVPRWSVIWKPNGLDLAVWTVLVCAVVGWPEAIEADLPGHREGNHLIPIRRQICVRFRLQDLVGEDFLVLVAFLETFDLLRDPVHPRGSHKVGVALSSPTEVDSLEFALSIMATARILHLRDELHHRCEGENGEVPGMVSGKLLGEAQLEGEELELFGLVLILSFHSCRMLQGVLATSVEEF